MRKLTGDRNPIHLSEHFAAKTPFGERIAHGLYTASLISAVLGTRLPGPGAIYISQSLNFRAPVRIGDTVDVTVTVAELVPERQRARLTCICKVGDEIVLDGEALVKVPSIGEIETAAAEIVSRRLRLTCWWKSHGSGTLTHRRPRRAERRRLSPRSLDLAADQFNAIVRRSGCSSPRSVTGIYWNGDADA